MQLGKSLAAAVLLSLAVVACSSDDTGAKSGNNQACAEGATCDNKCDADPSACNMTCPKNAKCTAICNSGQTCNFTCDATATCNFNCAAGSCTVSGGASCTCTGNCLGTCGGTGAGGSAGTGAGGSAGSTSCQDACGDPSDPGYAACIAACAT